MKNTPTEPSTGTELMDDWRAQGADGRNLARARRGAEAIYGRRWREVAERPGPDGVPLGDSPAFLRQMAEKGADLEVLAAIQRPNGSYPTPAELLSDSGFSERFGAESHPGHPLAVAQYAASIRYHRWHAEADVGVPESVGSPAAFDAIADFEREHAEALYTESHPEHGRRVRERRTLYENAHGSAPWGPEQMAHAEEVRAFEQEHKRELASELHPDHARVVQERDDLRQNLTRRGAGLVEPEGSGSDT